MNEKPLVSIYCVTYNHEKYIAQALLGMLRQKVNFAYEIVVSDDCSQDNTALIIEDLNNKFPGKIKAKVNKTNKGMVKNSLDTLERCSGKYIAMCEGDDYWTDENKLQKQIDILEQNLNYVLCSHRFLIYDDDKNQMLEHYNRTQFNDSINGIEFGIKEFFDFVYAKTMTVVFRRELIDLSELRKLKVFDDTNLFFYLLKKGTGYCMNFVGAVYRTRQGSVYSKTNEENRLQINYNVLNDLYYNNPEVVELTEVYLKGIEHYFRFILHNFNEERIEHLCKLTDEYQNIIYASKAQGTINKSEFFKSGIVNLINDKYRKIPMAEREKKLNLIMSFCLLILGERAFVNLEYDFALQYLIYGVKINADTEFVLLISKMLLAKNLLDQLKTFIIEVKSSFNNTESFDEIERMLKDFIVNNN